MQKIETDHESGAEVYQLTEEPRPSDNIYGEQPYASPEGSRIAIRHYPDGDLDGGLSILDLEQGRLCPVLTTVPRFPAFHSWGDYLYYQEEVDDGLTLNRCHYQTLEKEEVAALPTNEGQFSYGTVSPDRRLYAASVHGEDKFCQVLLIDLADGGKRQLAQTTTQYFKHEQFSRDGRNCVLIQANSSDRSVVNLGVMEPDKEGIEWLPVDRPHTPRCTGHETWVGESGRVFLSTGYDEERGGNLWTAGLDEPSPTLVWRTPLRFGHVSASRCGRFWIADAPGEEGVPIYMGCFESGRQTRVVHSHTSHDGKQWSHTHPYLTADSRWLIYTSNRSGIPQVHGARIPEDFLAGL